MLFQPLRPGYSQLVVESSQIKPTIAAQGEFVNFMESMTTLFGEWQEQWQERLKGLELGFKPKSLVWEMGESLLACYEGKPLVDAYGIYQHLLDYWAEVMQDDCYLIADDGWKAETRRLIERKEAKEGKVTEKDKGWICDLIPKGLVVARYFASEQGTIAQLEADLEAVTAERTELEEEHSGEDGFLAELDKINKANVAARLKEIKDDRQANDEEQVLKVWQRLYNQEADLKRSIKEKGEVLDRLAYEKYPQLSVAEVQSLVVEDK
jgi:type I restriction enzyme M protein